MRQAADAALQLEMHLKNAFNAKTGKFDISAFQRSLAQGNVTLEQYSARLRSLGAEGQQAFLKVAQAVASAELPIRRSSAALDQLWITMKNTMRWQLTSSMLHGFIGAVQTAYGYTQDLNESLNSIRIVTQKSVEDMDKFAEKANQAARTLSTTTTRYTDASLIYYQQGLSDAEVEARTNVTIKLANAAGESAETASEQLTAVWNNFAKGADDLEHYADVLTALGATTASSTEEISSGIQKFAAVANTVGLSYEYATSALATLTATTRESADTVGTALRTIFGRLESLKLGETLEDDTTLAKYSEALMKVGVNIKDASGNLKDMDSILDGTMAKWQNLDRAQRVALAQTVAGVRQYAQFMALMDNADFFRQNLETARNAEGSLDKQAQIFAESWEAARNRMRAAAEEIYSDIVDDKAFIDLTDRLTSVLNRVDDIVKSVGGLKGILVSLSGIILTTYSGKFSQGLRDAAYNLTQMTGAAEKLSIEFKKAAMAQVEQMNVTDGAASSALEKQTLATQEIGNLQIEIQGRYRSLTDLQQQAVNQEMELVKASQQRLDIIVEQARELQSQAKVYEDLMISGNEGLNLQKLEKSFVTSPQSARWQAGLETAFGKSYSTLSADLTDIATLETVIAKYNEFKQTLAENAVEQKNLSDKLKELKKTLSDTDPQVVDLTDKIAKQKEQAQKNTDAFGALSRLLHSFDFSGGSSAVDGFTEATTRLKDRTIDAAMALQSIREEIPKVYDALYGARAGIVDWSNVIVGVGQALTSLRMGMTAFSSIQRALSDETMTTAERITTLATAITTLTYVIRPATQALSTFHKAIAAAGSARIANNAASMDAAAAASKEAIAKALATNATRAEAEAAGRAAAAKSLENAAFTAGLPIVAAYAAAILAVVGIVYLLVKAHNASADAAKKATEEYKKATEAAEAASDAYKDLANSIKNYDESIAAIKDLTAGTEEFEEATKKANEQARELLDTYKELRNNYYYDENGVIRFNEGALSRAINSANQRAYDADIYAQTKEINSIQANLTNDTTIATRGVREVSSKGNLTNEEFKQAYNEWLQVEKNIDTLRERLSWLGHFDSDKVQEIFENYERTLSQANRDLEYRYSEVARMSLERAGVSGSALNAVSLAAGRIASSSGVYETTYNEQQTYWKSQKTNDLVAKYARAKGYQSSSYQGNFTKGITFDEDSSGTTLKRDDLVDYLAALDAQAKATGQALDEVVPKYNAALEAISTEIKDSSVQEILTKALNGENIDPSELTPTLVAKIQEVFKQGTIRDTFRDFGGENGEAFVEGLDETFNNSFDAWSGSLEDKFNQLGEAGEAARQKAYEALQKIANGDILDNATIETLKASFEGIADLTGFEKLTVDEQIKTLTTLAKGADTSVSAQEKYVKELKKQLDELSDKDNPLYISLELKTKEAERQLEKLKKQAERDPWNIDLFDERAISAEVGNVRKALSLIDKEQKVSSENLVELAQRYPEALVNAHYEASDNTLRINDEMYEKLRGLDEGLLDTKRDNAAEELLTRAQTEAGVLQVMSIAEEAKRNEDDTTLRTALDNNTIKETDLKETAHRIFVATLQEEINKRKEAINTRVATVSQMKATEATTANSLKAISDNAKIAAENFQSYFIDALVNTSENMAKVAADPTGFFRENASKAIRSGNQAWVGNAEVVSADKYETEYKESEEYKTNQRELTLLERIYSIGEKLNEEGSLSEDDKWLARHYIGELGKTGSITSEERGVLNSYINGDYLKTTYRGIGTSGGDTAQSNTAKAFEEINKILAPLIAGKEEKNRNGSSSAAKTQKETLEKVKEQEERYHRINRLIDQQDELLSKLDTQADRTFGSQRLAIYERQMKELTQQADNYGEKLKEAETEWLPKDAENLLERFAYADVRDGIVQNTHDLLDDAIAEYNGAISTYNDFLKIWNGYTAEQQASYKQSKQDADEILKKAKQKYELDAKAIEQYEETIDLIRELKEKQAEELRKERDLELSSLNYQLQIKLDVRDLRKQINDFSRSIAESTGDALNQIPKVVPLNIEDAETELALYDEYLQKYSEYKSILANADEYTNIDATREAMEELTSQIISSGENLLEWLDYWENMVPDAVAAAADRFSAFTDQLAHNSTVLDSIKELYALQGQTYKTQKGFERLQKVSQERMKASTATAQLQRKWFENSQRELEEAQKALDAYKGGEGTAEYDFLKKQRDAFLEQFNASQEAYLSAAIDALNAAKDIYVEQIEKAAYDFGQKMVEGLGATDLSMLQEQYDHFIEVEEEYFDEVNSAYHQTTWYNKIEAEIANSTNKAYQERLALFKEEVVAKRTSAEFDQYDLDVIEARYKILQAEAALEEAKNNATSLSLVRDSQGNWNYRYVADQKEIDKARQNVLDAQNEYYNLTKKRTKEVTKSIIDNWNDCQEAIKALQELGIEDEEEYRQREAEIREYYSERNRYLLAEQAQAIDDMTQAGSESISNFDNTYAQSLSSMTTNGQNFEQALDKALEQCRSHFGEFQTTTKDVADKTGTELDELSTDVSEVSTATDTLKRKGQECADALYSKIGKISDVAQSYRDLAGDIQKAIDKIEELARVQGKDIEESYNNVGNYDAGVDYSQKMNDYVQNKLGEGASISDILNSTEYKTLEKERLNKIKGLALQKGEDYELTNDELREMFKKGIFFDTGGYTGDFSDAKLAFLHEKELVLNQEDTRNMLAAVAMVRDIARALDGNVQAAIGQMASLVSGFIAPAASQNTSTTNYFDVNFPNAVYASEIEEALNNLINNAEQYAGGA